MLYVVKGFRKTQINAPMGAPGHQIVQIGHFEVGNFIYFTPKTYFRWGRGWTAKWWQYLHLSANKFGKDFFWKTEEMPRKLLIDSVQLSWSRRRGVSRWRKKNSNKNSNNHGHSLGFHWFIINKSLVFDQNTFNNNGQINANYD